MMGTQLMEEARRRLPGGDQRPLRAGQEDAAGAGAGLPAAVWLQLHLPAPGQPLWTGDNFDPRSSHVIPALIRKILAAKQNREKAVEVWGDGSASREFLYVDDAAEAIGLATERYEGSEPVNLGAGREITIKSLVTVLCELIGYEGQIKWDTTTPNGQPRRSLDVGRAEKEFGFRSRTDFETGLPRTVDWWAKQEAAQSSSVAKRGQPAPVS
jgi:dTDP-D-glucose 4,6-dehydratase